MKNPIFVILLGAAIVFGIVFTFTGAKAQVPTKMEHAIVSSYLCGRMSSEAKEFIVTPSKVGYNIVTWCINGVSMMLYVPEDKPTTKDV